MNEFFKKPVVKILMLKGEKGDKGNTGAGFPKGGKTGQYLQKKTDKDYDFAWSPITTVSWDNVSGKTNATESAAGLMSAEDKSKLDNLQVGGRNLYYLKDFSLLSKTNISSFSVESGEITVTASDSDMFFGYVSLSSGETYSEKFGPLMYVEGASFVTASISNHEFNKNYFTFFDKDKKSISRFQFTSNSAKGIVVPSGATYCILRVGKFNAVTGTVYKTRVKVERGNVATDWTPAPEDVDSKIDGVNSKVDGVNSKVDNVNSKVDALNSVTKSFTLFAASWVMIRGWRCYVIEDALVTSTSNQEVVLTQSNLTLEQLKAFQRANLVGSQENGKMYLWVYGAQPTIDIPIHVIFRGNI